jgi:hypothetical protein
MLENYDFLLLVQVFGCPAYVLDPKLQDRKITSQMGPPKVTAGRIRNIETGNVSPQFHIVYGPFFMADPTAGDPELLDIDRINLNALLIVGHGQPSQRI